MKNMLRFLNHRTLLIRYAVPVVKGCAGATSVLTSWAGFCWRKTPTPLLARFRSHRSAQRRTAIHRSMCKGVRVPASADAVQYELGGGASSPAHDRYPVAL